MPTEHVTVSLDADLAAAVRKAANKDGLDTRRRLASQGLADVVADWEAEHGEFTTQELEQVQKRFNA